MWQNNERVCVSSVDQAASQHDPIPEVESNQAASSTSVQCGPEQLLEPQTYSHTAESNVTVASAATTQQGPWQQEVTEPAPTAGTSNHTVTSNVSSSSSAQEGRQQQEVTEPVATADKLQDIVMPLPMRKRGRPKGINNTVIGLPRKCRAVTALLPFVKLSQKDRAKGMLTVMVRF